MRLGSLHPQLRGDQRRELSTREVAQALDVPVSSADRAAAALRDALTLSVTSYNVAHDATRRARRTRLAQPRSIMERPVPGQRDAFGL
jgi:precorrin-4 methylase